MSKKVMILWVPRGSKPKPKEKAYPLEEGESMIDYINKLDRMKDRSFDYYYLFSYEEEE